MQLKVSFSLAAWGAKELDGATFDVADPPAAVSFRKLNEGELVSPEKVGDILVTSIGVFEPTRKIREWLTASESDPMPVELAEGTYNRSRQLRAAAQRVVDVVQWVAAHTSEMKLTKSFRRDEFCVDGGPWRRVETTIDLKLSFTQAGRVINATVLEEVREVLSRGGEEPLSNVLLREAWGLLATSPRSALVLGISSLESCVKHLIVSCVPDAKWLVENVPSPPIESMLKNFIGELKTKARINGKVLPPPKPLLDCIKNAVALRNRVVHGISQGVPSERVKEYLGAIADINVLMNIYGGDTWALKNLSVEASKALKESLGTP